MFVRAKLEDLAQEGHPRRLRVAIGDALRGIRQDSPANINGSDE